MAIDMTSLLLGRRCPLCGKRKRDLFPHLGGAHGVLPSEKSELALGGRVRGRHAR